MVIMMKKRIDKKKGIREGNLFATILIYFFAACIAFITIYPVYYVLILSLSSPEYAVTMRVYWWPKGFYLDGYARVLKDTQFWFSFRNTVLYVVSQLVLMLITCTLTAYPLTVKGLKGRKILTTYLLIPMYFSGGIIPSYLLVLNLGLYNTPFALILTGSFSIWYIILVKSYFSTIPESLREAAKMDGANHWKILLSIYLPASKPILAVIALYTIVGVWNGWFSAFLYLTKVEWQPLQLYLRRILVENSVKLADTLLTEAERLAAQKELLVNSQLKYTVIFVSMIPMMILYPFFQKFFVKGVMLGSLKE